MSLQKHFIQILEEIGSDEYANRHNAVQESLLFAPRQVLSSHSPSSLHLPSHLSLNSMKNIIAKTPSIWDKVHYSIHPSFCLPSKRASRKQIQLEWLVHYFLLIYDGHSPLTVVDFCSGAGHIGLLLASLFPSLHVILVERNKTACRRAAYRKYAAGLTNVSILPISILDYPIETLPFDIAIGLHACGWLSDFIISLSLRVQASFLLCPCCVGKIGLYPPGTFASPLKSSFTRSLIMEDDYAHVFAAADNNQYHTYLCEGECVSEESSPLLGALNRGEAADYHCEEWLQHLCTSLQPWHKGTSSVGLNAERSKEERKGEELESDGEEGDECEDEEDGEEETDNIYLSYDYLSHVFGEGMKGKKDVRTFEGNNLLERIYASNGQSEENRETWQKEMPLENDTKEEREGEIRDEKRLEEINLLRSSFNVGLTHLPLDVQLKVIRKREKQHLKQMAKRKKNVAAAATSPVFCKKDQVYTRLARKLVDLDRCLWTRQSHFGYKLITSNMPSKATPKRDILIGKFNL